MDNLAPRIVDLVGRLAGPGQVAAAQASPPDREATARGYRQVLTRWFELTALGQGRTRRR